MAKVLYYSVSDYFSQEREPMNELVASISSTGRAEKVANKRSVTVRMPVSLVAVIDAIAAHTDSTRSETLVKVLDSAVKEIIGMLNADDRKALAILSHQFEGEWAENFDPADEIEAIEAEQEERVERAIEKHEQQQILESLRLDLVTNNQEKGE